MDDGSRKAGSITPRTHKRTGLAEAFWDAADRRRLRLPVGNRFPMTQHGRARRLLFITSDLGGGTANHLLSMTKLWAPDCWQPELLSECSPKAGRIHPGIPITVLPPPRWFDRYPICQMRRLAQVARHVKATAPDLVHTYFFWSIMYGRILKRLGAIRYLVENREDQGFSWGRQEYALLGATRSLPDRVICVSDAVREVAVAKERLDAERVEVIHNGVEPAEPSPDARGAVRRELGIADDALVVGMVANLQRGELKGERYFLEAIPSISQAVPKSHFMLVGMLGDEGALRDRVEELGIRECVTLTGYRADVARLYPAMDLSVLTSLTEGLSMTVLESMNHGLPVVVTRVGGNPEVVVDGRTGYLVPSRDAGAFANRVVELLLDSGLRSRMGHAARGRIEQHFSLKQISLRYLEMYGRILGAARSSRGSKLPDTGAPHFRG